MLNKINLLTQKQAWMTGLWMSARTRVSPDILDRNFRIKQPSGPDLISTFSFQVSIFQLCFVNKNNLSDTFAIRIYIDKYCRTMFKTIVSISCFQFFFMAGVYVLKKEHVCKDFGLGECAREERMVCTLKLWWALLYDSTNASLKHLKFTFKSFFSIYFT